MLNYFKGEKMELTDSLTEFLVTEEATIYNAEELKNKFIELLENYETLVLNHIDLKEFDLTYLQILISLKRYAEENNKRVLIKNVNDEFWNVLKRTGLTMLNEIVEVSTEVKNG